MAIETLIGGWFASAVIGRLVNEAFSHVKKQHSEGHKAGIKAELGRLEVALPQIKAVVEAAEKGQIKDSELKKWLWKLKAAALDAEDVLDELEYQELEKKVMANAGVTEKVKRRVAKWNRRQDSTVDRLRVVVASLATVASSVDLFVKLVNNLQSQQQQPAESSSLLPDPQVVGRDDEKKKIIDWLMAPASDGKNLSVLSIVGDGGLGKTTLAQLVFNDQSIRDHFDGLMMWVCVSGGFDVSSITRSMLESVTKSNPNVNTLNSLQGILKEKVISSKRFLLVLDDVWNDESADDWSTLLAPLREGKGGGKILVTTRMASVAKLISTAVVPGGAEEPIALGGLKGGMFLSLFNKHAFGPSNPNHCQKLKSVGEQIANKLRGSPLNAKMIGGVLRSKLEAKHWNDVLSSCKTYRGHRAITGLLKLSYNYLPPHLRACFAFCSVFPQNHKFDKDTLVQMWMAVGLIRQPDEHEEEKLLEDIGAACLDDLVKKSFFEEFEHSNSEKYYIMHDLLHDLARDVSAGESFAVVDDKSLAAIPETVLHLSVTTDNPDLLLEKVSKLKYLRTLIFCFHGYDAQKHGTIIKQLIKAVKGLRALCLNVEDIQELPGTIAGLKHLRYLNLSGTCIVSLESICELYHLQAVVCDRLEPSKVLHPKGVKNLFNLRHLVPPQGAIELAAGIGRLASLQELDGLVPREGRGDGLRELKQMNKLRNLRVQNLENVKSYGEASEAQLDHKEHLIQLSLQWSTPNSGRNTGSKLDAEVFDCLKPHSNLEFLTVTGYRGVRSAVWMELSHTRDSNLTHIKLEGCSGLLDLPPFGQLQYLQYLCLKDMHAVRQVGRRFYGGSTSSCFPSLKVLHFGGMKKWSKWFGKEAANARQWFPCLGELRIEGCPELRELPSLPPSLTELVVVDVGLTALPGMLSGKGRSSSPTLSKLTISSCTSLKSLAEGLLEHQNQHHLTSLKDLTIQGCGELVDFPGKGFRNLGSLEVLKMFNCPKMRIQNNLLPSSLQCLCLGNCGDEEKTFHKLLYGLTSLSELVLDDCESMTSLPSAKVLTKLKVPQNLKLSRCKGLVSLGDLHALRSLRSLAIEGCSALIRVAELSAKEVQAADEELRLSLDRLIIDHPALLLATPLRSLTSIQYVSFRDFGNHRSFPVEVEKWLLQNKSSLRCLEMHNVVCLEFLPASLRNLSSLEVLKLVSAPKLRSLPPLPKSLKTLDIPDCHQSLKKRFLKDEDDVGHGLVAFLG